MYDRRIWQDVHILQNARITIQCGNGDSEIILLEINFSAYLSPHDIIFFV